LVVEKVGNAAAELHGRSSPGLVVPAVYYGKKVPKYRKLGKRNPCGIGLSWGRRGWRSRVVRLSSAEQAPSLGGDHLRRPGRVERHLDVDVRMQRAERLLDVRYQHRSCRTGLCGEGHRHLERAVLLAQIVDEPQVDDVEPHFGVDHLPQRIARP